MTSSRHIGVRPDGQAANRAAIVTVPSRDTGLTQEYLRVEELAERLKLKPKSVRNLMYNGTLRRGEHWFSPPGLGPRFRWTAVVAWIESAGQLSAPGDIGAAFGPEVPPARRGLRRRRHP